MTFRLSRFVGCIHSLFEPPSTFIRSFCEQSTKPRDGKWAPPGMLWYATGVLDCVEQLRSGRSSVVSSAPPPPVPVPTALFAADIPSWNAFLAAILFSDHPPAMVHRGNTRFPVQCAKQNRACSIPLCYLAERHAMAVLTLTIAGT